MICIGHNGVKIFQADIARWEIINKNTFVWRRDDHKPYKVIGDLSSKLVSEKGPYLGAVSSAQLP